MQHSLAAVLVVKKGGRQTCEEVVMVTYLKLVVAIETGLRVQPTHFTDKESEA